MKARRDSTLPSALVRQKNKKPKIENRPADLTIKTNVAGGLSDRGSAKPSAGNKLCTCWCEKKTLSVPLDDILAGLTASCGRRGCEKPA